jgi:Domain of unknown function (DUF4386)
MLTSRQITIAPRKIALFAGIFYLLTFVSIPTLSLYSSIHKPYYIVGPGPDAQVIIGVILELIVALSGIATAVTLYPLLKKQNEIMAIGLVGSRILEASTIFLGAAFLLSVVAMRQSGVGTEALSTGHALVFLYDRIFLIGQSLMPVFNDLLLGFLFYQSRLFPRALALIGIFGAFLLVSSDILVLFGLIEQRSALAGLSAVPVAIFEFTLGIWLVVKGFNPSSPLLEKYILK